MLTSRMRVVPAVVGAVVLALTLLGPPAAADVICDPIVNPDGTVINPCEDDGGGGGPGGGGDDGNDGGGGGPQKCDYLGEEIPCASSYGTWNGGCYVRAASPQPSKDEPLWRGNDEGYILECTPYECAQAGGDLTNCAGHGYYWSPDAPAPVGPSAEELARRAVTQMQLSTGQVGSTPPSSANSPGSVGAIGLPIWLWIANRAENTTGPITRTAADGGLSVSARGTLERVEWTLTDANGATRGSITCTGANAAGTPYDGRDSAEPSPTCGFGPDLNSTPGTLTLTGAAHWTVEWQGGGQNGQINVSPPGSSTQVRIGELQVLVGR